MVRYEPRPFVALVDPTAPMEPQDRILDAWATAKTVKIVKTFSGRTGLSSALSFAALSRTGLVASTKLALSQDLDEAWEMIERLRQERDMWIHLADEEEPAKN
ncbi:MAG: hypothetical protein ACYC2H_00530 [Thermoplasmatota archaeon]